MKGIRIAMIGHGLTDNSCYQEHDFDGVIVSYSKCNAYILILHVIMNTFYYISFRFMDIFSIYQCHFGIEWLYSL